MKTIINARTHAPADSDASQRSCKDSVRNMQESSTTAKKRCGGTWTSAFRTACSLYVVSSNASSSDGTETERERERGDVLVARCTIARVRSPICK